MKCEKCGAEVLHVPSLDVIMHDELYMVGGRCVQCHTAYQIPWRVHKRHRLLRIEDFKL